MLQMGFEPTIPAVEQTRSFLALDTATTVTSMLIIISSIIKINVFSAQFF
jgi:hypothetical protein